MTGMYIILGAITILMLSLLIWVTIIDHRDKKTKLAAS